MVTPVCLHPSRNVQNKGSGPRFAGNNDGCTLRQPRCAISKVARGIRCEKQATQITSGWYAVSVETVAGSDKRCTSHRGIFRCQASCTMLLSSDELSTESVERDG